MAEIVNLRKARKQVARRHQEQRAAENRIVHGRSKAERALEQTRREQLARIIEQHVLKAEPES